MKISPSHSPCAVYAGVIIEGGVCSGKSTLAASLGDALHWAIIPEYMDWIVQRGLQAPQVTSGNRFSGFLEVEGQRAASAAALEGAAVADRSIVTLLAFELAQKRLDRPSSWPVVLEAAIAAPVILPHRMISVRCQHRVRTARWLARGNPANSPFLDPVVNDTLNERAERTASYCPLLILDSDTLSPAETLRKALEFVASSSPAVRNPSSFWRTQDDD
tara:strand:+ start:95 stop:748 length:654 start_codon:yes stop_codon:yes gene_type:complete